MDKNHKPIEKPLPCLFTQDPRIQLPLSNSNGNIISYKRNDGIIVGIYNHADDTSTKNIATD